MLMTTAHSYKGYESEVVLIPGVDQFVTGQGQILANALYVAMTRARSLLAIYGTTQGGASADKIVQSVKTCLELLDCKPRVEHLDDESNESRDTNSK